MWLYIFKEDPMLLHENVPHFVCLFIPLYAESYYLLVRSIIAVPPNKTLLPNDMAAFPFFMPPHLYLIFTVDMGQYSRPPNPLSYYAHTCSLAHMHSGLARALWQPINAWGREAEGETQTQREAAGTCKCKHVSPPVPNVSSHYIQLPTPLVQLGYSAALPKSYGIGLSL